MKPKRPSMRRDTRLLSRMPRLLHIGTYGVDAKRSRMAAKAASLKCPGPRGIAVVMCFEECSYGARAEPNHGSVHHIVSEEGTSATDGIHSSDDIRERH